MSAGIFHDTIAGILNALLKVPVSSIFFVRNVYARFVGKSLANIHTAHTMEMINVKQQPQIMSMFTT
jgi:hypothetical protein